MKKYILFDLDGTLTDPMEGICKSAARGLAHFGIKADGVRTIFGPNVERC